MIHYTTFEEWIKRNGEVLSDEEIMKIAEDERLLHPYDENEEYEDEDDGMEYVKRKAKPYVKKVPREEAR